MNKKITIVTHSGSFHTDDVFAVATLCLLLEKENEIKIIRTRDNEIIHTGDYVVDCGFVYEPSIHRFDHHQEGGAGTRSNGIPYSSFGLVWKEYGHILAGGEVEAIALDREVVQPIDAMDNGITFMKTEREGLYMPSIKDIVNSFRITWKEDESELDTNFLYLVNVAKMFIQREIKRIKDNKEGSEIIKSLIANNKDKRLLIIDKHYEYELVTYMYEELLLVVYPKRQDSTWGVEVVRKDYHSYEGKILFPEEWAGKTRQELVQLTGISDIIFCHTKRFLVVTKTKQSAIEIAHLTFKKLGL